MRIYTGPNHLLEPAMLEALRASMNAYSGAHIVVVPKQLTLQTERTLLRALDLPGSFRLQVLSPERLCGRIFESAGLPDGARVDERGRVMLVRQAIREAGDALRLYRGAEHRRGFADRCARQLELTRQAGVTPEKLRACADGSSGLMAMKLHDLAEILEVYERLIEGRFQDGESEFINAVARAGRADFLREARVTFFGFDLTPPTLHDLMAAVGAACPEACAFLPLENDPEARDFDCYIPMQSSLDRLCRACAAAGVDVERVPVTDEEGVPGALFVPAPDQARELAHLARELFAFPAKPAPADYKPKHIQLAVARNPMEECLFAAALCRRMAMARNLRWRDMLILCRDVETYHQPLKAAFRAYGVPIFLSSSRPAARHALAECLDSALRLIDVRPQPEDAPALMRTGFMPVDPDEAARLTNHAVKYGLRPRALLNPLKRGTEAELHALEPVRERFAEPLNALKGRLKRARDLRGQLAAIFDFLTDINAAGRLEARIAGLIEAGMREQAGEESQVWNRVIGALDQMAALMGDAPLPVRELRETLMESLEAAIIKPLPQSDDAVYAQTTDRITAQRARVVLLLGETDRAGQDTGGLLNAAQVQALSRMANAYLGSDDDELSRMRRFYIKSAFAMASDYVCVSYPLSGMDNASQHPGQLIGLIRGLFPGMKARGGVTEDESLQRMLRAAPKPAAAHAARALSACAEGAPMSRLDEAALAGLVRLAGDSPELRRDVERLRGALDRAGTVEALRPDTARQLYGELRRQSVTRLERFAQCPFAYFTQYGLRPERLEPYRLSVQDEGTFFHDAVHEFMLASMDDLNQIELDEAQARMDVIADRLLDQMAAQGPLGDSAVALAERRRLKATARTCAGVLAEHMHMSRFIPAALETSFGREDGPARLVVNAVSGACVLEGRIDRVDEWVDGGYLRVIDYKRGGKALNLDAVYHGLSLQLPVYLAAAMRRRGEKSAGVYYFNLDEGILALQTTDANAVEKQRRSQFRLSGLAPDDPDVLAALSPNFPEVLNVRVGKDGSLYKGTMATDAHGFEALTGRALDRASGHLDAIRGGDAAIAPAEFRAQRPCQWCDWRAICRFDERLDARCVRRFPSIRGTEVLEKIKLESGSSR